MADIIILTDYHGFFGSKTDAVPYLSGMNLKLIHDNFTKAGHRCEVFRFTDIDFRKSDYTGKYILYTSSEDTGYHYKDYIEDIVLALEVAGAHVVPSYLYLRANNNKVFMELMRDQAKLDSLQNILSEHFGSKEDFLRKREKLLTPLVLKAPRGAMSKGVYLVKNSAKLNKKAKQFSRSRNLFREIWEIGRTIKYPKYLRESRYRNKFISQNFVPNLTNDWKILIYGRKYYVLFRENRPGDFRASGSGRFGFKRELPHGMLDYAKSIYTYMDLPNLSLDIAYDGNEFYLLEFQAVYFGNTTLVKSEFYFLDMEGRWDIVDEKSVLEKEYVESICAYINRKEGLVSE